MTKAAVATKQDIENVLKALVSLDEKTADRIEALDKKTADRIDDLDKKTADRIDDLDKKTADRIDDLDKKTADRIDDVLGVLDVMMTRIDTRFNRIESDLESTQHQVQNILTRLDGIDKRLEISEDERLVMAHQLTRLHEWVERAAERINVKFAR